MLAVKGLVEPHLLFFLTDAEPDGFFNQEIYNGCSDRCDSDRRRHPHNLDSELIPGSPGGAAGCVRHPAVPDEKTEEQNTEITAMATKLCIMVPRTFLLLTNPP